MKPGKGTSSVLKEAILDSGLPQGVVARRVPLTRSFLNRIANRKELPREWIRLRLSKILKTDAKDLFPEYVFPEDSMPKEKVITLPDLAEIVRKEHRGAVDEYSTLKEGVFFARKEGLSLHRTMQMLDVVFREILLDLADGHRVIIRGFGSFFTVERKAYIWRHNDGKIKHTPAVTKVCFKPGKLLRASMKAAHRGEE